MYEKVFYQITNTYLINEERQKKKINKFSQRKKSYKIKKKFTNN